MLRSWQLNCPWQPNLQNFPSRNQVSGGGRLVGLSNTLGLVNGALTAVEVLATPTDPLAMPPLATLPLAILRARPFLSLLVSLPLLNSSVCAESSLAVSRLAVR
eukprot:GHVR01040692.1.p2 GENE.GHVR01040692.1~~GHVR01040692.1.p2  ORF type:complete len:104 (+),score=8.02 GHVR01040692.1:191-502(+)